VAYSVSQGDLVAAGLRGLGGHLKKTGGVRIAILVLVYGLCTGALGCELLLGEGAGSGGVGEEKSGTGPSEAPGAPAPPSATSARALLGGIEVAPVGSMAGYSREEFPHWAASGTKFGWDEPDGSCDVRDDALIRDGQGVEVDTECSFTSGKWLDPYTGATLTEPADVDIDHVVPLANAWRSGGDGWGASKRENYANDPGVLLSVDDAANQVKGDKGPEAWRPPNVDHHCEYARRWISIKDQWNLSVNSQEKAALQDMLEKCGAP